MCFKVKTQNLSGAENSRVFSPIICPPHMLSIRHVSRCLLLQFWVHTHRSCEAGKHLMHACILDFLAVVVTCHICSVFFSCTTLYIRLNTQIVFFLMLKYFLGSLPFQVVYSIYSGLRGVILLAPYQAFPNIKAELVTISPWWWAPE